MSILKNVLVKPYIEIDFDENQKFRVPAKRSDCEGMLKVWPDLESRLKAAETGTPEEQSAVIEEAFVLLCGGSRDIVDACFDYLTDGGQIPKSEVVVNLIPVAQYIAGLWKEHIDAIGIKRDANIDRYLGKSDDAI